VNHCYVVFETQDGEHAFEPLAVWLELPDPDPGARLVFGLDALLEWCNQERSPDGSLHKLVSGPRGIGIKRARPGPGYWIAHPKPVNERATEYEAQRCTRFDGSAEPKPLQITSFDELAAVLGVGHG